MCSQDNQRGKMEKLYYWETSSKSLKLLQKFIEL